MGVAVPLTLGANVEQAMTASPTIVTAETIRLNERFISSPGFFSLLRLWLSQAQQKASG
jgi:hypothetical protein